MMSAHAGRIRVVLGMLMSGVLVPGMVSNAHRVMVHLGPFDCDGTLTTRNRRRAQHGCGNRAPNRDQNRKQYQQPNPNGSHSEVRLAQRANEASRDSNGPSKAAARAQGVDLVTRYPAPTTRRSADDCDASMNSAKAVIAFALYINEGPPPM
jgi:hypothetical protein